MKCRLNCVQRGFSRAYYHLGKFIYRNPACFLLVPTFLTILGVMYFDPTEKHTGYDNIFVKGGNVEKTHMRSLKHFGGQVEFGAKVLLGGDRLPQQQTRRRRRDVHIDQVGNFNGTRSLKRVKRDDGRVHREVFAIVLAKDRSNIFTKRHFAQARAIHTSFADLIRPDRCSDCLGSRVLELEDIVDLVEKGEFNLTWPGLLHPFRYEPYLLAGLVASPNLSVDQNTLLSSPGLLFIYKIHEANLDLAHELEAQLIYHPEKLEAEYPDMTIGLFADYAGFLDGQSKIQMVSASMPFAISATLLVAIATSWTWDPVKVKVIPLLLAAVYSLMAGFTSMGFLRYLQVDWLMLNLGTMFFVIGVGIDDSFVMLGAWRNTNPALSAEERMGQVFAEAAVAITVTSLTDSISFWIGTWTPLKFCRIFCTYAGMGMTLLYFFQLSMFGATLAIFGRLEQQNRHFLGCCKLRQRDEAVEAKGLMRICCTGGEGKSGLVKPREAFFVKMFRHFWGPLLQNTIVRIFVFIAYIAYLYGAIHFLLQMKSTADMSIMFTDNTPWAKVGQMATTEFAYVGPRFQVGIYGSVDYWDPKVQLDLELMTTEVEAHPWVGESIYTESWLRGFLSFVDLNSEFIPMNISSKEGFMDILQTYYAVNKDVSKNIQFSADGKSIEASRFIFQTIALGASPDYQIFLRQQVQDILDKYKPNYDMEVFDMLFYFFEKDLILPGYTAQALGMAAVSMLVIAYMFIPSIPVACWIGFTIASMELGVAGYLVTVGGKFDFVLAVGLLMSIGFCVDFASHISYAFSTSEFESPDEKINDALGKLGWPIVQAALTTVTGTVALIFMPAYPMRMLGWTTLFIMVLGLFHGLVILPILLQTSSQCSAYVHRAIFGAKAKRTAAGRRRSTADRRDQNFHGNNLAMPERPAGYGGGHSNSQMGEILGRQQREDRHSMRESDHNIARKAGATNEAFAKDVGDDDAFNGVNRPRRDNRHFQNPQQLHAQREDILRPSAFLFPGVDSGAMMADALPSRAPDGKYNRRESEQSSKTQHWGRTVESPATAIRGPDTSNRLPRSEAPVPNAQNLMTRMPHADKMADGGDENGSRSKGTRAAQLDIRSRRSLSMPGSHDEK